MKAKSVKREAKKKRMIRNYFLFVTISVKRYPYLLEFTNCTRKGKNSCTKMQHILYFLDKNNICLGQLLFCKKMQAGFGDQIPKSPRGKNGQKDFFSYFFFFALTIKN